MSEAHETKKDARLKLPFIPKHYELSYERIDLKSFSFAGTVAILAQGRSQDEVGTSFPNSVTIHCHELQIIEAKLQYEDVILSAQEFNYHIRNQTCTIVFSSSNETTKIWKDAREYILKLSFRGEVNDKLRGLYRSTYVDATDGTSHIIATTQFEPTDARRAFPW